MFKTCVVAHWLADGVKVYEPPVVLLTVDGDQLPLMPLGDVLVNTGAVEPEQIGAIAGKLGVVSGVMVTVRTCVGELTHSVAAAVNV